MMKTEAKNLNFIQLILILLITSIVPVGSVYGQMGTEDETQKIWSQLIQRFPELDPKTHFQGVKSIAAEAATVPWGSYHTSLVNSDANAARYFRHWEQASGLGEDFRDAAATLFAGMKFNKANSKMKWKVEFSPFLDFRPDGWTNDGDLLDLWLAHSRHKLIQGLTELTDFKEPKDPHGQAHAFITYDLIAPYVEEMRSRLDSATNQVEIDKIQLTLFHLDNALYLTAYYQDISKMLDELHNMKIVVKKFSQFARDSIGSFQLPTLSATWVASTEKGQIPSAKVAIGKWMEEISNPKFLSKIPAVLVNFDSFSRRLVSILNDIKDSINGTTRKDDDAFIAYSFDSDFEKFLGDAEFSQMTAVRLASHWDLHSLAMVAKYDFPVGRKNFLFALGGLPLSFEEMREQLYLNDPQAANFGFGAMGASLRMLRAAALIDPKAPAGDFDQEDATIENGRFEHLSYVASIETSSIPGGDWNTVWDGYLEPRWGAEVLRFAISQEPTLSRYGFSYDEVRDGVATQIAKQLFAQYPRLQPRILEDELKELQKRFREVRKLKNEVENSDAPSQAAIDAYKVQMEQIRDLMANNLKAQAAATEKTLELRPELRVLWGGEAAQIYSRAVNRISSLDLESLDHIQTQAGLIDGVQFNRAAMLTWDEGLKEVVRGMDITGDHRVTREDVELYEMLINKRLLSVGRLF